MLPKSAITSASGSIVSTACRLNAGTHRRVTSVTMPNAPSPTRATRSSSGSLRFVGTHHRPVAGDELDTDDRRRQVAECGARAVRRGRRGAGDRLPVDVAEVGHRQAPVERAASLRSREPDARLHGHVGAGDAQHAVHGVERDQVAVGHRRVGERVAAADRLHALAPPPRPDGRSPRPRRCWPADAPRRARIVGSRPSSAC